MLKVLGENKKEHKTSWLKPFFMEFRRRLIYLLPGSLKELCSPTAISLLISKLYKNKPQGITFFYFHIVLLLLIIVEGRYDIYRAECKLVTCLIFF